MTSTGPLLMLPYKESAWYVIEPNKTGQGRGYEVKQSALYGATGVVPFDLSDIYLRTTQRKDVEEFWGYHRVEFSDPKSVNFIVMLRKVTLKPGLSGFDQEDIDFPHHKHFLGVGYFIVEDIDGDGLDEIILVEETAGKLTFGEESVLYGDIKDYIHLLKWDGSKYRDMWVSPPYTKRGTKLLVDDIKNTRKKQLVVLTAYGTVQVWERQ
jgi:hypothetical protein